MGDVLSDLVVKVILFLVIIVGAYYTTKFVGKRTVGTTNGKYIKVIDKLFLARDKWLYIIKVGDDYHLLSVTNGGIRQICTLNGEIFAKDSDISTQKKENIFLKYLNKIKWPGRDRADDYDIFVGNESRFQDKIDWINNFKKENFRD
ncbi:MAG TPA: FliO/MopB family protein [Clostridiales bacterium]|jgi:flagellar protein FliO/FliZ|nr:FliO/MopB family protein [Clostridiales bacterium]